MLLALGCYIPLAAMFCLLFGAKPKAHLLLLFPYSVFNFQTHSHGSCEHVPCFCGLNELSSSRLQICNQLSNVASSQCCVPCLRVFACTYSLYCIDTACRSFSQACLPTQQKNTPGIYHTTRELAYKQN